MHPDKQDLIRKLNRSGKRLSKGHRRIAEYIIEHYDKAIFMTASKLGEKVGISESTVVRFAAALGYEGYPQLQKALQELVRHRLTVVQRFEMSTDINPSEVLRTVLRTDMQNIRQTIEEIDERVFDEVVERLLGARHIYVLGVRAAAPLASFLGYYLSFVFENVHVAATGVIDIFERIARISAEDVLIGISFPRYSTRTLEAMSFAKSHGAQVIAITDGPMSPLVDAATICLTAHTDMASFVDSLAAPLSMINALIVALGLHRRQELTDHFALLEDIWDAYHVYSETDKS
ncbi:MAG: MurR/RpiR family transcriptional regulator [Oscillospiraceae bacterium]|nr:MurR/RpiR family transcriptional regulator [Oscillospiraceae bacterium]